MELKDLKELPGLRLNVDKLDVDPMPIVEHAFFERRDLVGDYRDHSIDFMVKNKIEFHSTCNNAYNLFKRFIKIKCPTCGHDMEISGGGGNSNSSSAEYICKDCHTQGFISIPNEGIGFDFKRNRDAWAGKNLPKKEKRKSKTIIVKSLQENERRLRYT